MEPFICVLTDLSDFGYEIKENGRSRVLLGKCVIVIYTTPLPPLNIASVA